MTLRYIGSRRNAKNVQFASKHLSTSIITPWIKIVNLYTSIVTKLSYKRCDVGWNWPIAEILANHHRYYHSSPPEPQEARINRISTKPTVFVFYDNWGIVYPNFVSRNHTVNSQFNCKFLQRLMEYIE